MIAYLFKALFLVVSFFILNFLSQIVMDTINRNGITLHRWHCGDSIFIARPELGARLMSWSLQGSDGDGRPVIYWPESADFDQFYRIRGGNPILFPFSARSFYRGKRGYWSDAGEIVRPMPMHGFARNNTFALIEADEQGFVAELQSTEDDREAYPFEYRFRVRYMFKERSLQVSMTLENLDDQPIQWSAGHHFYFTLPWKPGTSREDYRFSIPAKSCYVHASDGSLSPVESFHTEDSFGNFENNDRIFTHLSGDCARVELVGSDEKLNISILQEANTASAENAYVIWSEAEDSPFYCVEPWMGPPNSPEHGMGLYEVAPGEQSRFAVEVSV